MVVEGEQVAGAPWQESKSDTSWSLVLKMTKRPSGLMEG